MQSIDLHINAVNQDTDIQLTHLRDVAKTDVQYSALVDMITEGFPGQKSKVPAHLMPFWKVRNDLCVEDGIVLKGAQLVIPQQERRNVLQRLHDAHQGIERTKKASKTGCLVARNVSRHQECRTRMQPVSGEAAKSKARNL